MEINEFKLEKETKLTTLELVEVGLAGLAICTIFYLLHWMGA